MAHKKLKRQGLNLEERCALLYGKGNWKIRGARSLKLGSIIVHDGPLGLRKPAQGSGDTLSMKEFVPATAYPAPALTACSFDRKLLHSLGESLAAECRANSTDILLAPGANIKRNPLCGRNFEYFSEDPLLSGEMASAYINGLQDSGVGCSLKHFACNSQEYYRMVNDSIVDERALRELYLKSFEIAVKKSSPWTIMCSYNKINGVYSSSNSYLLKDILRNEWGYKGVVISDWGATADNILDHNRGLDVEMPCQFKRKKELIRAARKGALSIHAIDESVDRILALHGKVVEGRKRDLAFDSDKAHALARTIAEKSAVLLQNDGLLPLKDYSDCCVIGEFARTPRYGGGGSSSVNAAHLVSFLDAVNANRKEMIPFAPGYTLDGERDANLAIEAIDLASKSKNVILFLGLPESYESEGFDRKNLLLPDEQTSLFSQLYSVNQNIIVVLTVGSPVEMSFRKKAKAILLMYLAGEAGGEATDRLLTGKVCPSGRLAESWPVHLSEVPSFGFYPGSQAQSLYRESIYVGYRYYATVNREVAYPFGHGLSYANIEYGDMSLTNATLDPDKKVKVSVEVRNLSSFPCEHVVELYSEPSKGNVFKPLRTLIAFDKIALKANDRKTVTFELTQSDFAHFDLGMHSFAVEGGVYTLEIGNSSTDIAKKIDLHVVSIWSFPSLRTQLPVYYAPGKDGFLSYDNDFETLLGRPVPLLHDSRSKPYTLDSTLSDIANTWIGKKVYKKAMEAIDLPEDDPNYGMMKAGITQTPLRSLGMGGQLDTKSTMAILAMANGRFIKAFNTYVFGYHRKFGKEEK